MKSALVIGLGQFGSNLARDLASRGNQVMIVDKDEDKLTDLLQVADGGRVGDCTVEDVIKALGVNEYDICFVCLGENHFQACLEITALLREYGAKFVVSKADRELHAKLLMKIGASEIVFPDKDSAGRCAVKYSSESIFDFIDLQDGYAIYEINPISFWLNKTLAEANIRAEYHVNVIAFKSSDGSLNMNLNAGDVIRPGMHLLVLGRTEDLKSIEKELKD